MADYAAWEYVILGLNFSESEDGVFVLPASDEEMAKDVASTLEGYDAVIIYKRCETSH